MTPPAPSGDALAAIGLDPTWSRHIDVPSHDGETHRWHLLDRPGSDDDAPVVLCLHGNPTWSFLWSRLLRELTPQHRVIAPDLLSMGFSGRVAPRRYRDRVADIADLLDALDLQRPVWVVAQDWGGAIAMGFAVAHRDRVSGMVLSNTGIAVPQGRRAPWLIRLAATKGVHRVATQSTPLFIAGTPRLPGRRLSTEQRRGLALPYHGRAERAAVADFVADVPFDAAHPSAADLAEVAARLPDLAMPVRLVWGAKDPVFDDDFAEDLRARFADVELHRIADTGHLTVLETSIAPFVEAAMSAPGASSASAASSADAEPVWSFVFDADQRTPADALAVSDAAADVAVSHAEFTDRVATLADALLARGVQPGQRVAVLVPPSVDLIAVVYACWRIGAITVVADRGLGVRGLGAAVRSARVQHVVGIAQALTAARVLRWAPTAQRHDVDELATAGSAAHFSELDPPSPGPHDPAAVVFTSGATGPAKGVRYTHAQLMAQRDALRALYGITGGDRFVAAFAPFAVFGPALGIATGLADMDVTSPATLTAAALDDACRRVGATMVFASPAALANVIRTADRPLPSLAAVRLIMSAGAPVPIRTLQQLQAMCPDAQLHTPYGMTEVLPVADISLTQREQIGAGRGVCVGRPVPGCEVRVVAIGPDSPLDALAADATGEVVVAAPWMSSGYDRLWHTQQLARPGAWHRTGDVGHLDAQGNLWIEGRVVHLIHAVDGPVTPVPLEVAVEAIPGVVRAAAVGIGPRGVQQVVIVVELIGGRSGASARPAAPDVVDAVRRACGPLSIAAVWTTGRLPVDIRHNAKIDRTALAATMERLLSGRSR